MEVDDIQTPQPACKFSRVNSNGVRIDSSKIALPNHHNHHHLDNSDEVVRRSDPTTTTTTTATTTATAAATATGQGGAEAVLGTNHRLRQWQHSSRIIRVSRASGGKDRHSKVWTAKGPRDRRVRLSVTTAIQFYDLQDRLGYDQPSKAVEWLIKAAADAINELPSLNSSCTFPPPETPSPRQLSDRAGGGGVLEVVDSGEPGGYNPNQIQNQSQHQQQQQMGSSSMSSEASKGSGLSLSRSEIRVKARERARERIAKEKEKEKERESKPTITRVNSTNVGSSNNLQQIPQTSSFTQLLMAGVNNLNDSNAAASSSPSAAGSGSAHQGPRSGTTTTNQWLTSASTTAMDYFGGTVGLMGGNGGSSSSRSTSGYSTGLIQVGSQVMSISPFSIGSQENHHHHHHQQEPQHNSEELHHQHQQQQQQQHFPFMADHHHHQHLIQQAAQNTANGAGNGGGEYNLNFSISSSSNSGGHLNGFSSTTSSNNRGTLQSNSPSLLPYLTRFSTDGSSVPFFLGGTAVENHNHNHQHQQQFHPPGLQLCYGGDEAGATHTRRGKEKSSTAATTTATVTATTKSFSSNHSNLWTQVNDDGAA